MPRGRGNAPVWRGALLRTSFAVLFIVAAVNGISMRDPSLKGEYVDANNLGGAVAVAYDATSQHAYVAAFSADCLTVLTSPPRANRPSLDPTATARISTERTA